MPEPEEPNVIRSAGRTRGLLATASLLAALCPILLTATPAAAATSSVPFSTIAAAPPTQDGPAAQRRDVDR